MIRPGLKTKILLSTDWLFNIYTFMVFNMAQKNYVDIQLIIWMILRSYFFYEALNPMNPGQFLVWQVGQIKPQIPIVIHYMTEL